HHHAPWALFLSHDGVPGSDGTRTHRRAHQSWSGRGSETGPDGRPEASHDPRAKSRRPNSCSAVGCRRVRWRIISGYRSRRSIDGCRLQAVQSPAGGTAISSGRAFICHGTHCLRVPPEQMTHRFLPIAPLRAAVFFPWRRTPCVNGTLITPTTVRRFLRT